MAKVSARDATIKLDDAGKTQRALSPDFSTAELTWTSESVDVTGFGSTVRERVHDVIQDWSFTFSGFYNTATNRAEELLLSDITIGGSTLLEFGPSGSSTGDVKYTACAILQDCNVQSSFDGAVTLSGTLIARSGSITRATY